MYSITRHIADDAVLHDQISAVREQNAVSAYSSTVNYQTRQCDGVKWAGVDCDAVAARDKHDTSFDTVGAGYGNRLGYEDRPEAGAVNCGDLTARVHNIDGLLEIPARRPERAGICVVAIGRDECP